MRYCLFVMLVLVLVLVAPRSTRAQDAARAGEGPFTGVELGPGILKSIGAPRRIQDWSQPEIDAYYRVLGFAARTDYSVQKRRARQNLRAEIDRFRRETETEYQNRLKAIAGRAEDVGVLKTARRKAAAAARRRQRMKLADRYEADTREFPLFARMTNSLLRDGGESRFRGKLVTMHGHIRRLVPYDALKNDFGVTRLYEAWFYTKDSATNPAVIICTSIPDGIPTGDRIAEEASVTGYVFRLHQYEAKSNKGRYAPMILASRIEWRPREPPREPPAWLPGALVALLVLIAAAIVFYGRRDKRTHRKAIDRAVQDGEDAPVIAPPDDAT